VSPNDLTTEMDVQHAGLDVANLPNERAAMFQKKMYQHLRVSQIPRRLFRGLLLELERADRPAENLTGKEEGRTTRKITQATPGESWRHECYQQRRMLGGQSVALVTLLDNMNRVLSFKPASPDGPRQRLTKIYCSGQRQ
jgi:hypothetical protein